MHKFASLVSKGSAAAVWRGARAALQPRSPLRCKAELTGRWTAAHLGVEVRGFSTEASLDGLSQLLTAEQQSLMHRERAVLVKLLTELTKIDADQADVEIIKDALLRVDDVFLLVVVGEFNSGKSTFLNALLGQKLLKEGVLPTTAKVCIIKHNGKQSSSLPQMAEQLEGDLDVIQLPIPTAWLSNVALVDTPGTNAIISRHEQLTQKIVPRSDLVVFLTSADRPFSESERLFLKTISDWHKKVVMVVNKIDLLQTEQEQASVFNFVKDHGRKLLGLEPAVFGISGRKALQAKLSNKTADSPSDADSRLWESSHFGELESYIHSLLSREEIVRSKLLNPLGVAETVVAHSLARMAQRREVLLSDLSTIKLIEESMDGFMQDMERDIKYERMQVEQALNAVVKRADEFLEENVSVFKPSTLMNATKFREDFEAQVLGDLNRPIDNIVDDMSTLIARRARSQASAVLEFVGRRPGSLSQSIVGSVTDDKFEAVRYTILERLGAGVSEVIQMFDKKKESQRISSKFQSAMVQTAVFGAGAATVGGLVAAQALDVTGILAASSLAVLGLVVLPYRRRAQRAEFRADIDKLKSRIDDVLAQHLEREMTKIRDRILDNIAPYTRFVKAEDEKVTNTTKVMKEIQHELRTIKDSIQ